MSYLPTLFQLTLIILKCAGILNVSWWIIMLPTLIPCTLVLLLFILVAVFGVKLK